MPPAWHVAATRFTKISAGRSSLRIEESAALPAPARISPPAATEQKQHQQNHQYDHHLLLPFHAFQCRSGTITKCVRIRQQSPRPSKAAHRGVGREYRAYLMSITRAAHQEQSQEFCKLTRSRATPRATPRKSRDLCTGVARATATLPVFTDVRMTGSCRSSFDFRVRLAADKNSRACNVEPH